MTTTLRAAARPLAIEVESIGTARVLHFRAADILSEENARIMGDGLRAALELEPDSGPVGRFVIDLAGVEFLSSAAMAKLILFQRRVRERGKDVVLCRLHPQVFRSFQVANLADFFSIHRDLDVALGFPSHAPRHAG